MSEKIPFFSGKQEIGIIIPLLGLLGIILYFTGWIYRWAYYGWYGLEVNLLDFPIRTYLFVPIQVFCGDYVAILRSILAIFTFGFITQFSLWVLTPLSTSLIVKRIIRQFHNGLSFFHSMFDWIPKNFLKEMIAIFWLLVILFWLARIQGLIDARRDAINSTSQLSILTLVLPEKHLAVGRKVDDDFTDIPLKGYRILGETRLLDDLLGKETNDSLIKEPRVWRLLIYNNGWIYLFRGLSIYSAPNDRPVILAIHEKNEGNLMVLAPNVPMSE